MAPALPQRVLRSERRALLPMAWYPTLLGERFACVQHDVVRGGHFRGEDGHTPLRSVRCAKDAWITKHLGVKRMLMRA
ncbi:hypothetical protein IU11_08075 [Cellulosimicrobium sp. MM]|nr:hypothetical protein IU11_08075 [Cellulosimicrobium sp. MM]